MDPKSSPRAQTPDVSASSDSLLDAPTDPLLEQMNTVLRFSSPPTAAAEQASRPRRFSDPDRPAAGSSTQPEPISVRSKDGSRWLPAPDEQSHKYGTKSSAIEDDADVAAVPSQPLQVHTCEAAICSVAKVFATTELLELILGMLSTRDVLNLRRTNRQWSETVKASPELRLHLFYYPQFARPASDFQLLPLSLPGLSVDLGEPLHLGQWIQVSLTPEAARKISREPRPNRRVRSRSIFEGLRGGLGKSGSDLMDSWPKQKAPEPSTRGLQYEDLFVTQPPIVGMQAFITKPSASSSSNDDRTEGLKHGETVPAAVAKISSDAGITLGFLAETAQSLLSTRKNAEGEVKVVFKAIVSFTNNTDAAPRKRGSARTVTRM